MPITSDDHFALRVRSKSSSSREGDVTIGLLPGEDVFQLLDQRLRPARVRA